MNYDKTVFCPLVFKLYHSKLNDRIYNIDIIPGDIVWLKYYKVKGVAIGKTQGYDIVNDAFSPSGYTYCVNHNAISFWLPTDFIQKKNLVIKELLLYTKAVHMKKMTNFVINYKTKRDIEW